jgi:hypothetical protein
MLVRRATLPRRRARRTRHLVVKLPNACSTNVLRLLNLCCDECAHERLVREKAAGRHLTSEEVRSLLASALVQHAMARLGLCLTDLLPELQATRLALPMTFAILEHLEKRRVEALIMVLRERERMISDIERTSVRPSTTDAVRRAARPDL